MHDALLLLPRKHYDYRTKNRVFVFITIKFRILNHVKNKQRTENICF